MKTLAVVFNNGEKELICLSFNKFANITPINYCFEGIKESITKETILKGLKIHLTSTKSETTSKRITKLIAKLT